MRGRLVSVQLANPGAGNQFALTVPAAKRWRFICGRGNYATSAAAGNRVVLAQVKDAAGNLLHVVATTFFQAASLNGDINFSAAPSSYANEVTAGNFILTLPVPPGLELLPGYQLVSAVRNIDAGDAWTGLSFLVEEWDL